MPNPRYTLIHGEYHIFYPDAPKSSPQPDGDTIKFKADHIEFVQNLGLFGKVPAKINQRKMVSVRLEGIDALETHFTTASGSLHQNEKYAYEARDSMLEQLGFKHVVFCKQNKNLVESVANNPQKGYIIANGIDGNGRVLGFVFPDTIDSLKTHSDGERIFLDENIMRQSINFRLVENGLVYAEIYTTLPMDLAKILKNEVKQSKAASKGFWPYESLNTQTEALLTKNTFTEFILWPKLFRRLANFFAEGISNLTSFDDWLRTSNSRDDQLILPNRELGNIHDMVNITQNKIKLRYEPEDVIILPD